MGVAFVCCLCLLAQDPQAELRLGAAAFERGVCPEAIQHLERAVSADPKLAMAHLRLGAAYEECLCQHGDCERRWREETEREYKTALALDPSLSEAAKNLASFFYRFARNEEAERYYREAAKLDSDDPEALYGIAALNGQRVYRVIVQEKIRIRVALEAPLISAPSCREIRANLLPAVEEGIALLTRVLPRVESRNVRTGVLSYMALLHKERAELQCGDYAAYRRGLKSERDWLKRYDAAVKKPAEFIDPRGYRWPPSPPPPPPKRGSRFR